MTTGGRGDATKAQPQLGRQSRGSGGGAIMRRYIIGVLAAAALILTCGVLTATGRADAPRIEKASVLFDEPVRLINVMLKGEYLFVHDGEKMARGEACSFVYSHVAGQEDNLVLSFHCEPVKRNKVDHFTVVVAMTDPKSNVFDLLEYQFTGSEEGHRAPKVETKH